MPLLLCADIAAAFVPGIQLPGASSRPACVARSSYAGARLGNFGPSLALRRGAARPGRAVGLMMSTPVDVKAVEEQIQEQGELVRSMKEAMKADAAAHSKEELSAAVDTLKALKAKIAAPAEPKKTEPAPPKQPQVWVASLSFSSSHTSSHGCNRIGSPAGWIDLDEQRLQGACVPRMCFV